MSGITLAGYRNIRPFIHTVVWAIYTGAILVPNYMRLHGVWKLIIPIYLCVIMVCYYFNNSVLVKKYFRKQQYKKYIAQTALTMLTALCVLSVVILIVDIVGNAVAYNRLVMMAKMSVAFIVEYTVLLLAKVAREFYVHSQRMKEVELQKLKYELQLLKQQLNPHFIFNTLNNIYTLVINKSPDAESALLRLSELFDYMLHESNEDRIELLKEIDFIQSYVDIQRLRLRNNQHVQFKIEGVPHGHITPLVFINFIENAFKHGFGSIVDGNVHYFISICIAIAEHDVVITVKNAIDKNRKINDNGIGISNARKRLVAIYGEEHVLRIAAENGLHEVYLKIPLYD